jgi:DNA repair protein SbcC/Rad50
MKLARLQLENFRSFEAADLALNVHGLIGVRGANGAGKSSLFEAIEFALYGKRVGRNSLPVRRASATNDDAPTRVRVEFYFGEHFMEVERTETSASFVMDSQTLASTLSGAAKETVRQLGLTREQFVATFYARQKEVQAFARADQRRESIDRLLGLTQARNAAGYARDDAKAQATVVSTLAEEQENLADARRTLTERRERAKQVAPAADEARAARDALRAKRTQAWNFFEEAQEQADSAQQARAAATLAVGREADARQQLAEAQTALAQAQAAAEELAALAPLTATLAERRAHVSELDLRQQAYQQFLTDRDARADAQRRAAEFQDQLEARPAPSPAAADLRGQVSQLRGEHDDATAALIAVNTELQELTEREGAATRAATARRRATELDQALEPLFDLAAKQAQGREAQIQLQARQVELQRALEAEREHLADVRRDGPEAHCIRCRRPYDDRYQAILEDFAAAIADLERRLAETTTQLAQAAQEQQALDNQVDALRRLEGERESLVVPDDAEDPAVVGRDLQSKQAQAAKLHGEIEAHTARIASLERALAEAEQQEADRRQLLSELGEAKAQEQAYAQRLSGSSVDSYDAETHAEARTALDEAQRASDRSSALRATADQQELLAQRVKSAEQALADATTRAAHATQHAEEFDEPEEALEQAKARLKALDAEIEQAETKVAETEQQAISESVDVKVAEDAVRRAQAQQRKLRAEQRESLLCDETARLLEDYATHAQRRAMPAVEKETAQLLGRLSSSRYEDVRLDDRAAMEIFADGEHRPLERFSGGEQDLANLCLRLALSQTFARQRGTDAGLIILDEVFGSQDLDRRTALLAQLRELKDEFSQVFIVSHFDDVVTGCDLEIEVQRREDLSVAAPVEKTSA